MYQQGDILWFAPKGEKLFRVRICGVSVNMAPVNVIYIVEPNCSDDDDEYEAHAYLRENNYDYSHFTVPQGCLI